MNPLIGQLTRNGKPVFYINEGGYQEGTVEQLEAILKGEPLPEVKAAPKAAKSFAEYNVRITFQFPAWDEKEGHLYRGIMAQSKKDAVKQVKRMARDDGHAVGGRGMYWFKAEKAE